MRKKKPVAKEEIRIRRAIKEIKDWFDNSGFTLTLSNIENHYPHKVSEALKTRIILDFNLTPNEDKD